MQMTVSDEVREALVEAVRRDRWIDSSGTSNAEWVALLSTRAVDTVLAHLEQVGWQSRLKGWKDSRVLHERPTTHTFDCQPVYCIRMTRDEENS